MNTDKTDLQKLKKRLANVEKQLNKCRTSVMQDGWQTQRFSSKSVKWDYYAREKMIIIGLIDEIESENQLK